jgi:hypothetical protein
LGLGSKSSGYDHNQSELGQKQRGSTWRASFASHKLK